MMIANFIACALALIAGALRFVYIAKKDDGANFFTVVTGIYIIIFATMTIFAEIRNRTLRKYFNFLDGKVGRGVFLFFIGVLILLNRAYEIIAGIAIGIIAVINCVMGWGQSSDGKDAQLQRDLKNDDI